MLDDLVKQDIQSKTVAPNIVSVGVTWVDGRVIFKPNTKHSNIWFGLCHYDAKVFAWTPSDFMKPLNITTIAVAPSDNYCEKAYSCINFKCHLNKFDVGLFLHEFDGCGFYSLGLPKNFKEKTTLWFNDGEWAEKWKDFLLKPEGGRLEFDPLKASQIGLL